MTYVGRTALVALALACMLAGAVDARAARRVFAPKMPPARAVDGSSRTRWASAPGRRPQWWQVDLGAERPIDKIVIGWAAAYASRYRVLTSRTGRSFEAVADVHASAARRRTVAFPQRIVRYVRIRVLTCAKRSGCSFWEAAVYGPRKRGRVPASGPSAPSASGPAASGPAASGPSASRPPIAGAPTSAPPPSGSSAPAPLSPAPPSPDPASSDPPSDPPTSACLPALGSFGVGAWPPGCWRPYGPSSPFNQPLPVDPRLTPDSAAIVQRVLGFGLPGNLIAGTAGTSGDYAHPSYYSQPGDPWFRVHCTESWGTCPIEGMLVQIPDAARPAGGSDGHMAVIDQSSGWEYDFWQVQSKPANGGTIEISWGGRTRLSGDGLGAGATAAGFGLQAGIIRAQELAAGEIDHALFMTVRCTTGGHVYPAQGGGATCSDPTDAPAGGMRFQLDYTPAQIDALTVPDWKKTILRALARYGAFIGDTGGPGFGFELESGQTYTSFGYPDAMVAFAQSQPGVSLYDGEYVFNLAAGVDWSRLRVIAPCVSQGTC